MQPSALSNESPSQKSKCGRCCNCIWQQAETQRLRPLRRHRRSSRRTRAEAQLFGPVSIDATLDQLAELAAQLDDPAALARAEVAQARIAEYDAEISQYRQSLKAGADPAVVGPWIAETQVKKITAQAEAHAATGRPQITRDEIAAIVTALGDPLSVSLREGAIIGHIDRWLALEFAPYRLAQTIRDLTDARQPTTASDASGNEETERKIADCDAKLAQYRAAFDAGANSATVAAWIAETEAERATHALAMR
jgi:hypothetical protein